MVCCSHLLLICTYMNNIIPWFIVLIILIALIIKWSIIVIKKGSNWVTQDKFYFFYKFFSYVAYIGTPLLCVFLFIILPIFCVNIWWGWLGSQQYNNIGCTHGSTINTIIMVWLMFMWLPILGYAALLQITILVKEIWLKFFFSLPIFFTFIYVLSVIILILDKSWMILGITIVWSLIGLWVYFAESDKKGEFPIFIPPSKWKASSLLEKEFSNIDISNVDYIHFHENSWKSYKISLNSIKTIAVYFYKKTNKKSFSPWELSNEWDFLLKNHPSDLKIEDYNKLISHLWNWIIVWGSFDIIYK